VALVAPQARHGTWYPQSFLAPFAANQPGLDAALERVGEVVAEIEAAGIPAERIVLFGFSQGACLASEFAARNPRRYGALVAATGGRIGPPGADFTSAGDLAGTPVHLSAGDPDPHVPWSRVEETAASLRAMGAVVTTLREPGFPHAVHPEAVAFLRGLVADLAG
jgi:phospholipase/carboxylesterase